MGRERERDPFFGFHSIVPNNWAGLDQNQFLGIQTSCPTWQIMTKAEPTARKLNPDFLWERQKLNKLIHNPCLLGVEFAGSGNKKLHERFEYM